MDEAVRLLTGEEDRLLRLAAKLVRNRVLEKPTGETKADWFMDDEDCPETATPEQEGV